VAQYNSLNRGDSTPNLEQAFSVFEQRFNAHFRVAIPAKIVKVGAGVVDVIPLLKIQPFEQEPRDYPVLYNIPVHVYGSTGSYRVSVKLNVGDGGLLVASDRCIAGLKTFNNPPVTKQEVIRYHELEDSVFIPGLSGENDQIISGSSEFVIKSNESGETAEIKISGDLIEISNSNIEIKAGDVKLGAGTFKKMLLETVKDLYNQHIHQTPQGPSGAPLPQYQIQNTDLTQDVKAS